jgi:addiction module RelE/StbE family toxin
MNLRFRPTFSASFRKLSRSDKRAVLDAPEHFRTNRHDPSLRNHPLGGGMTGWRALVVDADLRIVFAERNDYAEVTLLRVGTHEDVYQR